MGDPVQDSDSHSPPRPDGATGRGAPGTVPLAPVACPHCGKVMRMPAMTQPQTATCSGCRQKFAVRPAEPLAQVPAEPVFPPPREQAVHPASHWPRMTPWLIVAGAGGALALVLLALLIFWPADNWERANQPRLLTLKADAEKLALAGKLPEAFEKYRELERAVGQRTIRSSYLRGELNQAAGQRQRVWEQLLAMHSASPPAPPTQPAPPVPQQAATLPTQPATRPPVAMIERPLPPPTQPVPTQPVATQSIQPATAPAWPERRVAYEIRPQPAAAELVTDEEIGPSIQRGVEYLIEQFDPNTFKLRPGPPRSYPEGLYALSVYALLQAGQASGDPRLDIRGPFMKGLLKELKSLKMEENKPVYERSLRATALAVYNRPEDRETLKSDVTSLINASLNGCYTYTLRTPAGRPGGGRAEPPMPPAGNWLGDPSNSQYGLLGVWSGAEVGIEVPQRYWMEVEGYWMGIQCTNGQWAYGNLRADTGTFSMTCAGIASLFVTHDWLDAARMGSAVGREPFSASLARALAWLEQGNNSVDVTAGSWYDGYNLYGLERVGLASGFKYFGAHDWYRELARRVIDSQRPDGSWARLQRRASGAGGLQVDVTVGDDSSLIDTSYALLFLSRGRHPLVLNKLRFDGFWANRPRDAANLARYAARQLERPLNWQVVSFGKDFADWMDCPILYLASHEALKLTDAQIQQLRNFALAGGLIFTQADGNSPAFDRFVVELSGKLFPEYELQGLPLDHELYSLAYPVNPKPPLKAVSNGSRILLLHSPTDLSQHWQMRAEKTHKNAFDLGTNLFLYASGKSDLRNRLSSTWLPAPAQPPAETLKLARLKYAGNWDPEPAAFVRFGRWLQKQTGLGLETTVVAMAGLKPEDAPLAHLTGTAGHTATQAEVTALRQYVQGGGVLIIDACGGNPAFANSVRTDLLPRAFPDATLGPIPAEHPIFAGGGGLEPIPVVPPLRSSAAQKLPRGAGGCQGFPAGKGYVIFCPVDLTSGLVGTNTWGILGARPEYAQSLLRNAVLWGNAKPGS